MVALFLIAAICLQLIFSDSAKQFVVKTINDRAATKIHVGGSIDFSVLGHFPFVSVDLNKVRIEDTFGSKTDLVDASKVSVQINIWDLINGTNTISKVLVTDGRAFIKVDKRGNANYFIFKKTDGTTVESVHINKIILKKVEADYNDEFNNQHYQTVLKEATLSGNFSNTQFDLSMSGDLFFHHLWVNGTDYATNKDIQVKGGITVNTETSTYKILSSKITVNSSDFIINGTVKDNNAHLFLDLFVSGAESGLADIGAILPNDYHRYLTNIQTKGKLSFTGTIKGKLSRKENPEVLFIFNVNNATVAHVNSKQQIEKVNLQAKFSNGSKRSWSDSYIKIQQGSAEFGKAPVRFDLHMSRFKNPVLQINLDGTFRLGVLAALLDNNQFDKLDGIITFQNFRYRGAAIDVNSKSAFTQSEGKIILQDVLYKNSVLELNSCNGVIELKNDIIGVSQLRGILNGTTINVNGEMNHFIPVLMRVLNDKNYRTPKSYFVNMNIETGDINSNIFYPTTNSNTISPDSTAILDRLLRCAAGTLNINVQSVTHQKLFASQLASSINFNNEKFYFNNLKLNTLKGSITANGSIDLSQDQFVHLDATMQVTSIDIKDVFTAFENFDQSSLTDKNINGILTSSLSLEALWYKGVFQADKLQVLADVSISKGELIDFKPMYALSKYVKIDELKDIRFTKLTNQISIQNKTVFIPTTVINTNALNLELSGTHTFDNYIDYNVKINLLQLLSNKFKNSNTFDPDAAEKDPSGLLNLYLTLKGPADNPDIKYDKRSVKTVIKESMKQEQQSFKDALRKEFNQQQQSQQKEIIKDWEPPQEYELIEFEDDSIPNQN